VPPDITHWPPQHSESCAHASPSWTQNEDAPHLPPALHSCEQHSPLPPHGLPSVLQAVLSGAHLLFAQFPLQHWLLPVHASVSATHAWSEHTLLSQRTEQQSVFAAHDEPGCEQVVGLAAQLPVLSQTPEQHIVPAEHGVPNTPHGLLASMLLPLFLLLPHAANSATRQTGSNQVPLMLLWSTIRGGE
jgi:hypothetical protein